MRPSCSRRALPRRAALTLPPLFPPLLLLLVSLALSLSPLTAAHPEPLRIITGVGRHSRGGTPILAPAVTKHLDRTGWRWKWDDGPLVAGGIGPVNSKGAVRVIGVAR